MQISRALTKQDHSIALVVTSHPRGWQVCREEDSNIARCVVYGDWHRVERAILDFERAATDLREQGWVDADDSVRRNAKPAA